MRNLLEELEPGRHRFLPIRIRHQKSNIDERPFYILHVTSVVRDTIVVEETRFADGIGKTDYFGGGQISVFGPIVVRSNAIAGRHFWRCGIGKIGGDSDPFAFDFFCSDVFYERMKMLNKALVEFHPCQEH